MAREGVWEGRTELGEERKQFRGGEKKVANGKAKERRRGGTKRNVKVWPTQSFVVARLAKYRQRLALFYGQIMPLTGFRPVGQ